MLDISEPSYMRRVVGLIAQREERNVIDDIKGNLILFDGILQERQEKIQVVESKLKKWRLRRIKLSPPLSSNKINLPKAVSFGQS